MFKMLFLLMPVLLIRCSAPEDQPPPEPSASTEAVQKKEEMKPDVRNVRWGMTMDEVTASESVSWTDEPNIVEKNKAGGATIIASVTIFGDNKAILLYEFEKNPRDTLALWFVEYKILGISDADYQALVLNLDMNHGKGSPFKGATIWKTEDRRTRIMAIRNDDLIKSLIIGYMDNRAFWRRTIEKNQSIQRDF